MDAIEWIEQFAIVIFCRDLGKTGEIRLFLNANGMIVLQIPDEVITIGLDSGMVRQPGAIVLLGVLLYSMLFANELSGGAISSFQAFSSAIFVSGCLGVRRLLFC